MRREKVCRKKNVHSNIATIGIKKLKAKSVVRARVICFCAERKRPSVVWAKLS